jgi:hypothetical protein
MVIAVITLAVGCNGKAPSGGSVSTGFTASTSTSTGTVGTASTQDSQCLVFANNTKDYTTCLACKTSMCPCQQVVGSTCVLADLGSCNVDSNLLVQCVHQNIVAAGGPCIGLKCGSNQVADFASCSCKDANPPSSIGAAPGNDDQSTPYMEAGFFVTSRNCAPDSATSGGTGCISSIPDASSNAPIHSFSPPSNVLQDVGYIRWDLTMDASQFGPATLLANRLTYTASWSTLPISMSMFYQLKPNTKIAVGQINFNDCVEHFSGFIPGSGVVTLSSNVPCTDRSAYASPGAPAPLSVNIIPTGPASGGASLKLVSANGSSANFNVTNRPTVVQAGTGSNNVGLDKLDIGTFGLTMDIGSSGLFSNIGYYKYSWGPLFYQMGSSPADIGTTMVTGRVAINANLGFSPAGAIESSAMSPTANSGVVSTRDCSTTAIPHPCVVTAAFRTPGGAVAVQSYGPAFVQNNEASGISTLPTGIVAVSTPKLIQDVTQFPPDSSTAPGAKYPARLRAFVRASDGNIYMSRFEKGQWHNWMSLGRPWTCVTASALAGDPCNTMINNLAPLYAPWVDGGDGDTFQSSFGNNVDDGISVVGEPAVAYYADPTQPNSPGVLAVFTRVSQIRSDNGLPGPLHNSLWFTVSVANALANPGETLEFDKPTSWTNWMPVSDDQNFGAPVIMQGNPTVMARGTMDSDGSAGWPGSRGSGSLAIYFFAVNSVSSQFVPLNLMHPPIAWAVPNKNGAPYHTGGISNDWFNYGTDWEWGQLLLDSVVTGTALWKYTFNPPLWATDFVSGLSGVATSDLTIVPSDGDTTSPSGLDMSSGIKLFGMRLVGHDCTGVGVSKPVAPCKYTVMTDVEEMNFDNFSGDETGLDWSCTDVSTSLSLMGTVSAVNLGFTGPTTTTNSGLANPDPSGMSTSDPIILIAGRSVCTNQTACDVSNPTLSYAALAAAADPTCGTDDHGTHYHPGQSIGLSGNKTRTMLPPFNVSSDAVVVVSHARWSALNADVPVYLITRDAAGNISHGYFDSYNNGQGTVQWKLFDASGPFSN